MLQLWQNLAQDAFGGLNSLSISAAGSVVLLCLIVTIILQSSASRRAAEKISNQKRTEQLVGKHENLDHAFARRQLRAAFQEQQMNLDHVLFRGNHGEVKTEESYETNSRGKEIFTKSWFANSVPLKALIFICHGYGDTCTFFIEGIARKLAVAGYGVFGMDYPGFGLSSGLHGYIPDFNELVDDVIENYSEIKARNEYKDIPSFLFGQSMGGAVALKVHFKEPSSWNGAVLVAPMCKIADDICPPWPLVQLLKMLVYLLPRAKLVPEQDLAYLAFKDAKKREQAAYNVIAYKDRVRLRTALEMLRATEDISSHLHQVSLPILILHGASDHVTDPSVSKALYEQCSSEDKTIHLYEDAWHSILEGEPEHTILQVLKDIVTWLDAHCTQIITEN